MGHEHALQVSILLSGGVIVLALLAKAGLQRIHASNVLGYIAIGFLLGLVDSRRPFLSEQTRQVFAFLANIGIICLLFRVGLESNLAGLLRQLRRARLIWIGNILLSGILGYAACVYLLGMAALPSLVVGVAMTATSVSIPVAVWQEAGAIGSPAGELLVDVAELDDISAIVLMALLFAVIPVSGEALAASESTMAALAGAFAWLMLKLTLFAVFCFLFSRWLEKPVTDFFKRVEAAPDPMVTITGIGFMIAAAAGLLGFSVAIGAFFAGLVFSRDPDAVKMETAIESVYALFIPFFFLHIGLGIRPDMVFAALGLGAVLLVVAVLGKFLGTALPGRCSGDWKSAVLLGASMVPRAEIAMVIAEQGHKMGEAVLPSSVYAAIVLVCAATTMVCPLVVRWLLKKWPQ
jgi:Kef-type K+ transport system membrane component KefB